MRFERVAAPASTSAGSLEGLVTTADGTVLRMPVALRRQPLAERTLLASPGEDGVHLFAGLELARWQVSCDAPGFLPASETLELTPEHPKAWFQLILEPTRTLRVRLVDEDGEPLVAALARDGLGPAFLPIVLASDGSRTHDLTADPLLRTWSTELPADATPGVWATLGERELARRPRVPAGEDVQLVVSVEAVKRASARLSLTLTRADGLPLVSPRAWIEIGRQGVALSVEAGRVEALVPPGRSTLWVTDQGAECVGRELVLAAGVAADEALELSENP